MKDIGALAVLAALAVAGCATTTNVVQIGPDSYSVGPHTGAATGSGPGANSRALEAASKYCGAMNRQLLVVKDDQETGQLDALGNATVQFKCT
jgi:hypothetical protein